MQAHRIQLGIGLANVVLIAAACAVCCGCGEPKVPILDDDSEAVRALKEAGAQIQRLPLPGGMGENQQAMRVELDDVHVNAEIMEHLNAVPMIVELRFPQADDSLLALLGDFKALSKLDLSESGVTDEGLKTLSSKSLPALYLLMLNGTGVTGDGLTNVPAQVQGLDLTDVPLEDSDLANLDHLRRLRSLTLTGTGISAAAVTSLKKQRPGLLVRGIRLN